MPKRGSVQFLLLSFRARPRLAWLAGAAAAIVALIGLAQTGDRFPVLERTGFGQLLYQSAWKKALSGQTEQAAWPWEDTTFVPSAKVPRLGLSAAVLMGANEGSEAWLRPLPGAELGKSDKDLRDVAVGDRITVTAADGSSHVYRVTGRRVVDPHLEDTDSGSGDGRGFAGDLLAARPLRRRLSAPHHPGDPGRADGYAGAKRRAEALAKNLTSW